MVKLNLNDGKNNLDVEGSAVIAIVIDPVGQDADCAALVLGETTKYKVAFEAGSGIGSIINQLGRNPFDKVELFGVVMERAKNAIKGGIKEENLKYEVKEVEEEKIFDGKMEGFLNRND